VDSCCYTEPWYMDRLQEFFDDPVFIETFRRLRHPCPEGLRPFLWEKGMPLQKINTYYRDDAHKAEVEQAYDRLFPDLVITSSGKRNLELNIASATKGGGLRALCRIRGVDPAEAVAFGDGTNDASMIQAAGLGVAMGNAAPELIAVADRVTLSNNEDGVAVLLEELLAQ